MQKGKVIIMKNTFLCKGKRLADYLIQNGSTLIKSDGFNTFYFEKDETIQPNLFKWEKLNKMSMF
jgi:hypothetical protein